jgi:hypothetical protein
MSVEHEAIKCRAPFLLATGYFARSCLSSDLITFNDKATAKNVGVPSQRNLVILFNEDLAAIRRIGGPCAVQVEGVGRKAE